MKNFVLLALCWTPATAAWSLLSSRSSFLGHRGHVVSSSTSLTSTRSGLLVMYTNNNDPSSSSSSSSKNSLPHDAWTVLAKTEAWISQTLQAVNNPSGPSASPSPSTSSSSASSNNNNNNNNNPYSRKEVSYLYESSPDVGMIIAGIFRRLKEARQLGRQHGRAQQQMQQQQMQQQQQQYTNKKEEPAVSTMRQTQVVVMPSNAELQENFVVFDALMEAIHTARRRARDLILTNTNDSSDSNDDDNNSSSSIIDEKWSVAVNCAHLHPQFGMKSVEQELQELKNKKEMQAEKEPEDLDFQAYQEKRLLARRSPYPTIVIEVRASPYAPPDMYSSSSPTQTDSSSSSSSAVDDKKVTPETIQRLEALFGRSPHFRDQQPQPPAKMVSRDQDFFDALTNHFVNDVVSSKTPLQECQDYFAATSTSTAAAAAAFTETNANQVDEAYEFVFTNLAMMLEEQSQREQQEAVDDKQRGVDDTRVKENNNNNKIRNRPYLVVLPRFCSTAATSLEKFGQSVAAIINTVPSLHRHGIVVSTFHPEHVDASRRAPHPVVALTWK
jgi:hypothetical protein